MASLDLSDKLFNGLQHDTKGWITERGSTAVLKT